MKLTHDMGTSANWLGTVKNETTNTAPTSNVIGDAYVVGSGAGSTGTWANLAKKVVIWGLSDKYSTTPVWLVYTPKKGCCVYNAATATQRVFSNDTFASGSWGSTSLLQGLTANVNELNILTGVAQTVSAAEIDTLDGVTATAAQINYLAGVTTPGTVVASKALVVDANKHINTLVISEGGLKLGATTGTAVTATAAELNVTAGVTAGEAAVGKAVVLTTGKAVDTLDIGTLKLGGTAVTADAAELNLLDTSVAGTNIASKALVAGANNNLDLLALPVSGLKIGAAAGTAVDATAAQLNFLANVSAGTTAASKAVVLGSDSKINAIDITALSVGGVAITATGAELNTLDVSAQAEAKTITGAISVTAMNTTLANATGADITYTLAAPGAGNVGRIKTIEMITRTSNDGIITPLTAIDGLTDPTKTKLTFGAVGDKLVLLATSATKWTVIKNIGVSEGTAA